MLKAIGRAIRGERSEGSSSAKREARSVPSSSATSRAAYAATPAILRSQPTSTTQVYRLERVDAQIKLPRTAEELKNIQDDLVAFATLMGQSVSEEGKKRLVRAVTKLETLREINRSDCDGIRRLEIDIQGDLTEYRILEEHERKQKAHESITPIAASEMRQLQAQRDEARRQLMIMQSTT